MTRSPSHQLAEPALHAKWLLDLAGGLLIVWALASSVSAGATDRRPEPREVLASVLQLTSGGVRLQAEHHRYESAHPSHFANFARVVTAILVPPGATPRISEHGDVHLPDGSLLSKKFLYENAAGGNECPVRQRFLDALTDVSDRHSGQRNCIVETRILYRKDGEWLPFVFAWENGEPNPVPGGRIVELNSRVDGNSEPTEFDYTIPGVADCRSCHQGSRHQTDFGPIGMNRSRVSLELIRSLGLDPVPGVRLAGVGSSSPSIPIETAARGYLNANCGYCHNPNGLAASSGLFLDLDELDPRRLGICKRPVALGFAVSGAVFDIEPGQPARSIMIARMSSLEPGLAMPETGRSFVDRAGVELISRWIAGMPEGCE